MRLNSFTRFSTFQWPKRRIKMAAQSHTFSADANAEEEPIKKVKTIKKIYGHDLSA